MLQSIIAYIINDNKVLSVSQGKIINRKNNEKRTANEFEKIEQNFQVAFISIGKIWRWISRIYEPEITREGTEGAWKGWKYK